MGDVAGQCGCGRGQGDFLGLRRQQSLAAASYAAKRSPPRLALRLALTPASRPATLPAVTVGFIAAKAIESHWAPNSVRHQENMSEPEFLLIVVEGQQLEIANVKTFLRSLDSFPLSDYAFLVRSVKKQELLQELERRNNGQAFFLTASLAYPVTLNSLPHNRSTPFHQWFHGVPEHQQ